MKEKPGQTPLSSDSASIQERQVTVRVLTIGTKQVTQTLYKQLPEESVISEVTGELQGEIWGWVNLHDKDCPNKYHLHAIWEDSGELKRSYVSITGHEDEYYRSLYSRLCVLSKIYIGFVAITGGTFANWHQGSKLTLTVKGISITISVPENVEAIWKAPYEIKHRQQAIAESKDPGWFQNDITFISERVESIKGKGIKECFGPHWDTYEDLAEQYTSHKDTYAGMERIADEINQRKECWINSYLAIRKTGQLFIAVSGVWK